MTGVPNTMKHFITIIIGILIACSTSFAQSDEKPTGATFDSAVSDTQRKLDQALAELSALRDEIAREKIPLTKRLNELEAQLSEVRSQYQQTTRTLDSRTLDLSNLRNEIKSRREESTYLSNLLGEYNRNFESRLHIAELQRYREQLSAAKLAPENSNLSESEVFKAQSALLTTSLDRLFDGLSGTRFEGTAVIADGLVKPGTFVLIGPAAWFRSADGAQVGTVEQRLGSLEPSVVPFKNALDTDAATQVITFSTGDMPLDPSLGNAHKIETTSETFLEHVKKGGPVMYPIFGIAAIAFLVAFIKFISLMLVRSPSRKRMAALLQAIAKKDKNGAMREAKAAPGPAGKMLVAGVGVYHLSDINQEPRELIEEVMYEKVLAAKLRLNSWLPFIAITAASAPLLGLLGTVTGIMNTFTLMTVFGTGDVKALSSGISEALITTKFGLYVAIPSLILYAFLSRRAKAIENKMEKAGVAMVNQIGKTPFRKVTVQTIDPSEYAPRSAVTEAEAASTRHQTTEQVKEILADMLRPLVKNVDDNDNDNDNVDDKPRRREVVSTSASRAGLDD